MPLDPHRRPPVMAITHATQPAVHVVQAQALGAAGVGWIQLRLKGAHHPVWLETARSFVAACRAAGAVAIVNDSVKVALASGANGVHLGRHDTEWREARRQLGPDFLLGGTVNDAGDARRAAAAGCLDYVGIGPLRFTATKRQLAPVLGLEGLARLLPLLGGLPAWAIGGVTPADMPELRRLGLAGAAVSSALLAGADIEARHAAFLSAWSTTLVPP